ncbi:MAG: HEAT repeat domain-containing protein [Candidatus Aminicenantes bacterium]|nr:HEAT repeat domain-containing protein [Candidatus Aminicenantes bacterium]
MRHAPFKGLFAAALVLGLLAASSPSGQRPGPPQKADPALQLPPSPLDGLLKQFLTFDGGIRSEVYWKIRDFIRARKDDPPARADCEIRLLAFLRSQATFPAKALVARELRTIAGERSIPTLQALLFDPALSDPARYVLESIPGPAADKALLDALDRATGTMKTGLIASLGVRKTPAVVPALAKYLEGSAQEFVKAAAMSLGRLGGREAAAALAKALPSLKGDFRAVAASALLDCAEDVLRAGDLEAAAGFYDKILALDPGPAVFRAATMGKIAAAGDKAPQLTLEIFRSPDPAAHEAAAAKAADVFGPDQGGPLAALLPSLPDESRVKLLAVLGGFRGEDVRACLREAASDDSPAVRTAALNALAAAGTPADAVFLAGRAASARGEEQAAARRALGLLKGRAADEAIVRALEDEAGDDVRAELIAAVGERRIFAAKTSLARQWESLSERIRLQTVKTLRTIGTPSDITALLNLLEKPLGEAEREEVENAAAALALKIAQPEGRSNLVKARLAAERDPARRAGLVRLLGKIGDESSLRAVRQALREADAGVVDAAVRALAGWPTSVPIEDVWDLAKSSADERHRLLALRGFIRMTVLGKHRRPDRVVADLKLAAEAARRPDEKRLVLAALPEFAGSEALALARSIGADPEVKAEAQAAADQVLKRMGAAK